MLIIRDFKEINHDIKSAVTIGTFDGIHLGHRKIIDKLISVSRNNVERSIVITFEPHPQIILKNRVHEIKILSTLDEKLEIFKKLGIDIAYVINFNIEFSKTSAEDFYLKYLINGTGLSDLVIGYDHMFGKNREGNFNTLNNLSEKYGFRIYKVDEYKHKNRHVSSTTIRHLLEDKGDVNTASIFLDRNYSIEGKVTEGRKLGREIGFPTANIILTSDYKLLPKIGVYAVTAEIEGNTYKGMLSIGINPTVSKDGLLKIEVNIFDFNENIYGKKVRINFLEYLRDEVKFDSLEELKKQLYADKEESLKIINN